MSTPKITDNERWLLSFYRASEIGGALFFGRVATTLRPGPLMAKVTHHFADEAAHANYWTETLERLDAPAFKLRARYQDRYFAEAGAPANLMEVLSITRAFEVRAHRMYTRHLQVPDLRPEIRGTIERILRDERWHLAYVCAELKAMRADYGEDAVATTMARHAGIDRVVYAKALAEHRDRLGFLVGEE